MLKQLERHNTFRKLDEYHANAYHIPDYQDKRFIIFSDAHKGDHRHTLDEFMPNEAVYCHALEHYLNEDYGLILNGDMEEGWKNRYADIVESYEDTVYRLESEFARQGEQRYLKIWGNHDADWRNPMLVRKYLSGVMKRHIRVHPAVMLGDKILITHGHQGDPNGDTTARFSQWVVRYLWQPIQWAFDLERHVASTLNVAWRRREKYLYAWAQAHQFLMIAGHTHRPMFFSEDTHHEPRITPCYLNAGSCLSREGITGIEIDRGEIRLVRWHCNEENHACERTVFHQACLGSMLASI